MVLINDNHINSISTKTKTKEGKTLKDRSLGKSARILIYFSPCSVRMRENTDHNNSEYRHYSCSGVMKSHNLISIVVKHVSIFVLFALQSNSDNFLCFETIVKNAFRQINTMKC